MANTCLIARRPWACRGRAAACFFAETRFPFIERKRTFPARLSLTESLFLFHKPLREVMHPQYSCFPCSYSIPSQLTFSAGTHSTAFTTQKVSQGSLSTGEAYPPPSGGIKATVPQGGQPHGHPGLNAKGDRARSGFVPSQLASPRNAIPHVRVYPDQGTAALTEAERAIAMHIDICNRYKLGRVSEKTVLKVTSASITHCSLEQALQCVKRLRAAGIAPDLIVCNAVLSVCEKEGQADEALAAFHAMKRAGMSRDAVTYTMLISALGKAGRADQALAVFNDMHIHGIAPDVITYNALIHALGKEWRVDQALAAFQHMKNAGVAPDAISYNTLIAVCQKSGRADLGPRLLRDAVSTGVFTQALGYCQERNCLNFHTDAIYKKPLPSQHEPSVSVDIAKALFRYHGELGHIQPGTGLIVGWHGRNSLKMVIQDCLEKYGMGSATGRFYNGKPNEDMLFATLPGRTAPQAGLNPDASPFFPSWKKKPSPPLAEASGRQRKQEK